MSSPSCADTREHYAATLPDGWRLSSVRLTVMYQTGEEAIETAIALGDRILSEQTSD